MGESFSVGWIRGEKIGTHSRGEILLRPIPFFGSSEPHGKLLYKGASSCRGACLPQRSTELWRMRSKKQAPADCAIRMTGMKQADQLRIARWPHRGRGQNPFCTATQEN